VSAIVDIVKHRIAHPGVDRRFPRTGVAVAERDLARGTPPAALSVGALPSCRRLCV